MSQDPAACAEEMIKRGSIRASDVVRLSDEYPDASAGAESAQLLFAVHEACPVQDPAWGEFFIDAIVAYVIQSREPAGYMTQSKAEWLIGRLAKSDGIVASTIEIECLVAVIERARWSPASLARFALAQVEHAVRHDKGPLRDGGRVARGSISAAEIGLVRRILCAHGGDRHVAITRLEAEVLFSIDEATGGAPPNPAWTDLFVKAITNALMSSSGHAVPTRAEALRAEPWAALCQELWPNPVLAAHSLLGLGSGANKYRKQMPEERALARLERQRIAIITDEAAPFADVGWLAQRLDRDARPTTGEQVLLGSLRQVRPRLHPLLQDVVERRAQAA